TQYSTLPLPLPCLTSSGFLVIGLSGNTRIHNLPPRLIWRVFPDKPITKKPLEVRQGKGKGNVEYWVALVQPGRVLYEIEGIPEDLAREAFSLAAAKLPVKTAFVSRTVM
ncbi:MAG: 50S ribosomal protein L16, partial [Gammaproteobacteria bacterium]|nr:50S ribosomal protein L16 [Gammaproteobacteria bacterium]